MEGSHPIYLAFGWQMVSIYLMRRRKRTIERIAIAIKYWPCLKSAGQIRSAYNKFMSEIDSLFE